MFDAHSTGKRHLWVVFQTNLWYHVVFHSITFSPFEMTKKPLRLSFLLALIQEIIVALYPLTENNTVLVGYAFQRFCARDWFNCVQACHDEPGCISYNYERSAGANGLCELNHCGVEELSYRNRLLIYSSGFVYQKIRKGKVSFTLGLDSEGLCCERYLLFLNEKLQSLRSMAQCILSTKDWENEAISFLLLWIEQKKGNSCSSYWKLHSLLLVLVIEFPEKTLGMIYKK